MFAVIPPIRSIHFNKKKINYKKRIAHISSKRLWPCIVVFSLAILHVRPQLHRSHVLVFYNTLILLLNNGHAWRAPANRKPNGLMCCVVSVRFFCTQKFFIRQWKHKMQMSLPGFEKKRKKNVSVRSLSLAPLFVACLQIIDHYALYTKKLTAFE